MTETQLHLRLGTRTSKLALWQTHHIIDRLKSAWSGLECEIIPFSTVGDKTQSEGKPLPEVGGKGLFTAELEEALRSGQIDLAVHSLKDLPVENAEGLTLGAIPDRADVRDALIARKGWTLSTLPQGAHIGTSSTRRAAQLRALRPDLIISSIRGNIDTRIRKVMNGDYDATLLALAGIDRLQLNDVISEILPLDVMLPAPGQGALAVQCRANDAQVLHLLSAIDDPATRAATTAERSFLAALGGGCAAPVAACAQVTVQGEFALQALVADPDGSSVVQVCDSMQLAPPTFDEQTARSFGMGLAQRALAKGADCILAHLGLTHKIQPLLGKRIVVTRRPEQAQELLAQLAELGAAPVAVPVIEIVPTEEWHEIDAAIQKLSSYDWLILTSANAVDLFFQRMQTLDQHSATLPPVAVVGTATTRALSQFGVQPRLVPTRANAEALAELLISVEGTLRGKKIVLPQAAIARRTLAETLAVAGATVTVLPIYDTIAAEPAAEALAELHNGVDAIIFSSGSTVHNFGELVRRQRLVTVVSKAAIFCIGPITAAEAAQQGLPATVVATEQSVSGIIQSLIDFYSAHSDDQQPPNLQS